MADYERALRELIAPLLDRPVVAPPGLDAVAARAHRLRTRRLRRRAALATTALLVAGSVRWVAGDTATTVHTAGRPEPGDTTTTTQAHDGPPTIGGRRTGQPPPKDGPSTTVPPVGQTGNLASRLHCQAGRNGGATDVGVTASRIRLFMNVTLDGPAASYTAGARTAVNAVTKKVNQAGGICGRRIDVIMRNGWFPPPDDAFAAMVEPLKPELDAEIRDGTVERRRVPTIGTDGLTAAQFTSPWVWPVGAPAATLTRIAVDHAYRSASARTFALVHDGDTFSTEAAAAFRAYVDSLPGASVRVVQQASAAHAVVSFNEACRDERCDAVVWALPPGMYRSWLNKQPTRARLVTAALSSALLDDLPGACAHSVVADPCGHLLVWTPYTPPIGPFLDDPYVTEYRETITAESASTDLTNPLTEGAYLGVQLLIEALTRAGPNVTRDRLRAVLNDMTYEPGLTSPMQWGAARVADRTARALRLQNGSFVDAGTGWVRDPQPGHFPQ